MNAYWKCTGPIRYIAELEYSGEARYVVRTSAYWLANLFIAVALTTAGCDCGSGGSNGTGDGGNNTGDGGNVQQDGGNQNGDGSVSTGDGGVDGGSDGGSTIVCKTTCAADDCGAVSDGCGSVIMCNQCSGVGEVCGLLRPNKCDVPPPPVCTPLTAAEACPGKCGAVSDGCSGTITCTGSNGGVSCTALQVCGGYSGNSAEANVCIDLPTCQPTTCAAQNVQCGTIGDGCEGTLDCTAITGGCTGGQVCGTGAQSGQCVDPPCTPSTAAQVCTGTCGIFDDGCGGQIDCDTASNGMGGTYACPAGYSCNMGMCSSNACVPIPSATVCAGKCGILSDGCSGSYNCDGTNGGVTCNGSAGETCGGAGTPNECGAPPCTPLTQAQACPAVGGNASCGQVSDGCNGLIDCGGCGAGQSCGLNQANVCGTIPVCVPLSSSTACAGKCGQVSDGCTGTYNCNGTNGGVTCTGTDFCGAITPNQCGTPPTTCTPSTCASLGHSCGFAGDGCGNTLNCWPNGSGNQCADPTSQSCIANAMTGAQSCVQGTGGCTGSLCTSLPTCSPASPTQLTGTVRTPGRNNNGTLINQIPVPNAIVYIPGDPSVPLPTILTGVDGTNPLSCGRCADERLVADGQTILASAVTDYRGQFTLSGRIPVGVPFNIVIKAGKWRRVVQIPALAAGAACTTTALTTDQTRLNANSTDGLTGTQLPRVAFSTGDVDEMECVFYNMGISLSEFSAPSGSGRIHLYYGNGVGMCTGTFNCNYTSNPTNCANTTGCTWTGSACTGTSQCSARSRNVDAYGCTNGRNGCSVIQTSETNLYRVASTLNSYDMVVFDCQAGTNGDYPTYIANMRNYVNNGGRMFASHWAYNWITSDTTATTGMSNSAAWNGSGSATSDTAYISLPTGVTARTQANAIKSILFRDWLNYQNAITIDANGPHFTIGDPRDLAGATVGTSTDEWCYRTKGATEGPTQTPVAVQQLSFNTPYSAAANAICGRVAYSGFHVGGSGVSNDGGNFPNNCPAATLSTQELALAFMLFDLSSCVSQGDPPAPPQCTPKTAAQVCPNPNDACGFVSDGCGGVVDCGGCGAGYYCDGTICRQQQCQPATCASLGYNCGSPPDGCGGIARDAQGNVGCGTCAAGQTCGLGGPGLCGSSSCVQIPFATACPAGSCGQVSDGCGGVWNCGQCTSGLACGGAGVPNQCGAGSCSPIPQATACLNKDCGSVSDGCGGAYTCGTCTSPDTCGGGGMANVCGHPSCTPVGQATACAGKNCGWVSDGCSGAYSCGSCTGTQVCGATTPNVCGGGCTPTTCQTAGAECGAISDLCGGILQCGTCPAGQVCGAAGANKCGNATCTPATCNSLGAECGLIGDGCGNVLNCGTCTAPESCGGAGVANQCGIGTGACTPTTCAAQGIACGAASDGCGALLNCGGCPSGYQCQSGICITLN